MSALGWCTALAWVCIVGCGPATEPVEASAPESEGAAEDPSVPVPRGPGSVTRVTIRDGQLDMGGESLPFPLPLADLIVVLGPPSRTRDEHLHTWDELGLLAWEDATRTQVDNLKVAFEPAGHPHSPARAFAGSVVLPGGVVSAETSEDELRAAGFAPTFRYGGSTTWDVRLGRFKLLVDRAAGVESVNLAYTGFALHEGKPTATPDMPLFRARSPDYGFPFDDELVEVERRGNVSILKVVKHDERSGGVVGRSMFAACATGELAARLGYDYSIPLRFDIEAGLQHVGFTNEREPSLALEFPDEAARGFDETLSPSGVEWDLGRQSLGAWPPAGSPAARAAEALEPGSPPDR